MKCPKCQYLNFEEGDRCRHCGYDLTLALDLPRPTEPVFGTATVEGPLADLALEGTPTASREARSTQPHRAGWSGRRSAKLDLPLFHGDSAAPLELPLGAGPPRPPLAVRRAVREPPRSRPATPRRRSPPMLALMTPAPEPIAQLPASWTRRLAAGGLDLLLLAMLDGSVVALTLKLCDLTLGDLEVLPAVPLGAFLLLLNGGYFVAFTAFGGRTLGKMASGIRIVSVRHGAVQPSAALVRTVSLLAGLLLLGVGFLPALFGAERRALHDRLAGTRVVRV